MAYQPGFMFHPAGSSPVSTLTLVGTGNVTSGATLSLPVGTIAGDLCIIVDGPRNNTASTPTKVTPTGFTQIGTDETYSGSAPGMRLCDWYKILDSTDISTGSITCMTGTNDDSKAILVFHPDHPISVVTIIDVESFFGTSNPTLQTLTPTFAPAVLVGVIRDSGATTGSNGTLIDDGTTISIGTSMRVDYLVQNGSVTSKTYDTGDAGTWNTLQTFSVQVS